ncbi:hypothetical protein M405DRAFT_832710, partial [Rhizopogon salebrosus TDB-379]
MEQESGAGLGQVRALLLPLGAVPLSRAHNDLALQSFSEGWSGTSLLQSFNAG